MAAQAESFSFYPAHAFTNEPFLRLADLIADHAPGTMRHNCKTWVTCTGTDAVDDDQGPGRRDNGLLHEGVRAVQAELN